MVHTTCAGVFLSACVASNDVPCFIRNLRQSSLLCFAAWCAARFPLLSPRVMSQSRCSRIIKQSRAESKKIKTVMSFRIDMPRETRRLRLDLSNYRSNLISVHSICVI